AESAKQQDQLRQAVEEARLAREALKAAEADRLAAEKAAQEARRSAEAAASVLPTPKAAPSTPPSQPGIRSPTQGTDFKVVGLRATLGDTIEKVGTVYSIKTDPSPFRVGFPGTATSQRLAHRVPLQGLYFLFDTDNSVYQVRMDAPFSGSVQGIRIGD